MGILAHFIYWLVIKFFVFVVCVHVSEVCVHVCAVAYACRDLNSASDVFFYHSPPYFFRQGLSLNLASGIHLSLSLYTHHTHAQVLGSHLHTTVPSFSWVLGSELTTSCVCIRHFTSGAICLSPTISL